MANGALQMSLKMVVSEERRKVVFVEAGEEFVDVLFSFMTMPIGMIVRLTRDHLKDEMGCLKNLYNSIRKLDEKYLRSAKCKNMLICPRSAAEFHYRKLKLDLIDSSANEYYVCQSCDLVSFYQTAHCRCKRPFQYSVKLSGNKSSDGGVFVKPTIRVTIDDKFRVEPVDTSNGLKLLAKLQIKDGRTRTENIGKDEVLKLMVRSLVSQTPLSDIFMNNPPESNTSSTICHGKYVLTRADQITDNASNQISLKLFIDRPKERVLYAEAGEDFVDLLCSFLTIPLCYFFKEFPRSRFKGSMGKLYKKIKDLDGNFFKSKEMKETLVNPKLAPGLAQVQRNQLIGIREASNPSYKTLCSNFHTERTLLGSNSKYQQVETGNGFVKGPSKFMVHNNLFVTPLSPSYGIDLMRKMKVHSKDIKKKKVNVDRDKALHLLAASLVSKSALTDVFKPKKQKQEQEQKPKPKPKQVNREDVDDDECCCCF